ncbi:MarR family winged helix-turn-helix transcriptional regulator [Corynebacterium sanguinis]|uniref:MarR family winged helix-turn-helix transcriptional regulator n=1 Tax=Corynebacterium sanguinis TaxID=2594913 RepID=UPI0010AA5D43|nr:MULTISPECIES: MarR family winged helix-turn-helix transcriptional regulator [Corynebacterium]MCT1464312.1 MarR family winged helix-turn-helix transcriptional regulator [Corynebacterium sanguinis]MCT1556125.1 MarR family winged helix-turn-helix transcriptional regulator [Corynebacterium sanguinis]MCT1584384.1 MarR family winged helix-turn-helix transcriptional regulator [Corynebacterium sanguinis]MCT1627821.1 MarR family winged helix-turn-helix transcriptional regulator [Corynebacterium sangu
MAEQPRWLNDGEQELWRLMLAASRKVDRVIDETLQAGSNLSSSEFAVLVSLSEAEGKELRLRDLCAVLDWDRSRTSHQVTRMQRRGLITKCKSPGDARGVLVKLTDDGLTRVTHAAPDHVESVRRIIFDHLEPEDIAALRRFFGGIMEVDNVPGIPKCSEINKFD